MSQLYQAVAQQAQTRAEHLAIVEGETRWTYAEFVRQIDQASAAFAARGIQAGDRVGLMLLNQKEFLVSLLALRRLGAVAVPINIQMLPEDIGFVIQNSGIRHLVIHASFLPMLAHLPLGFIVVGADADTALPQTAQPYDAFLATGAGSTPPEAAGDPKVLAFLIYTSGTTGHPKGVMLSEANLLANIEGVERALVFGEADRMVMALPLFHAYGLIVALTGLTHGAMLTLVPKFQPKAILEAIVVEQATILPLVPTLYSVLLELVARQPGLQLPKLRFCVSGGAALPAALLQKIEAILGAPVLEGYGMTETAPVITVNDPQTGSIPECVGKPLFNVQVRILRDDDTPAMVGEVGEVVVKGDNVMLGYYNLPEETAVVMTPDGWLRTGDLGHLDEAGRLYISGGRKKDLIIKGGENISPLSIEAVLYRHESIMDAAVVAIPHEKLGEDIAACISLKEGHHLTPQEVIRFCREHLTAAYVPAHVEILEALPKNPTGKIVKKLLKAQLAERALSSTS